MRLIVGILFTLFACSAFALSVEACEHPQHTKIHLTFHPGTGPTMVAVLDNGGDNGPKLVKINHFALLPEVAELKIEKIKERKRYLDTKVRFTPLAHYAHFRYQKWLV